MAGNFNGTSSYIEDTFTGITTYPFTFFCRCTLKADATSILVYYGSNTTVGSHSAIAVDWDGSALNFKALVRTGVAREAIETIPRNHNQWYNVCGVFRSTTNREIWVDGVKTATNTLSRSMHGLAVSATGRRSNNAGDAYHDGLISHSAMWNTGLSEGSIIELNHKNPDQVMATNLVHYHKVGGGVTLEEDHSINNTFGTPTDVLPASNAGLNEDIIKRLNRPQLMHVASSTPVTSTTKRSFVPMVIG